MIRQRFRRIQNMGTRLLLAGTASLLPGGSRLAPFFLRIPGFLYPHEGLLLYRIARDSPARGARVEIGSLLGLSSACISAGLMDRGTGKLFCIDPHLHQTRSYFERNMEICGCRAQVEMLVMKSDQAIDSWQEPVGMVFIDGDHRERIVEADVENWLRHLSPGGFMLLHDAVRWSPFDGPLRVANRWLVVGPFFDRVGQTGSIRWGRRRGGRHSWLPAKVGRGIDLALRLKRRHAVQT